MPQPPPPVVFGQAMRLRLDLDSSRVPGRTPRVPLPEAVAGALATLFLAVACGGGAGTEARSDGTGASAALGGAGGEVDGSGEGRLGSDVIPERYALDLSVDPSREALFGIVRIDVDLVRRTDEILLHGQGLDVKEATLQVLGDEAPLEATWTQVDDEGLARLSLPQQAGPGAAILRIVWSAPYAKNLQGAYQVAVGDDRYVFTQFEPLSARTVFPCFDEPRFKTPYDLSLTVRPEDVAISNAPAESQTDAVNDRKRVRFERTRPLPTYLVAFAVGPFDLVESEIPPNDIRSRPLPFRGVAVRGEGELLAYAMEHTPVLLSGLEEYFGTGYPYEKLDIIAVPDFGAGAMENAGAVTFRDTLLLIDPESAPGGQKMRFAGTMAHELAHHWFGNQVTLAWWNDLWLNEGFATWVESKSVAAWSPRDEPELHDRLWIMQAMRVDGLSSARQVRQPIASSHDIHNAFDTITYGKGAGVLAMYERWLGETTFRDAVRRYLRENRRAGVARSEDFFAALDAEAESPLTPSLRTFIEQPGIPTVATRLACDEEGGGIRVEVRQERYRPAGSTVEAEGRWQIPMCLRWAGGGRTCALVTEAEQAIPLEGAERCPQWFHPDAEGTGYYLWTMPTDQLDDLRRRGLDDLTPGEKLSVVGALNAGFKSGAFPAADVLSLYGRFTTDDSRPVAIAPMDVLAFVEEHLVSEDQSAEFRRYARALYERHYDRLGLEKNRRESAATSRLRADVIGYMVQVADQRPVLNEAVRAARSLTGYRRDEDFHLDEAPPELFDTALVIAAEIGDRRYFDHLESMFDKAGTPRVRRALLVALSSFRDDELADRSRRLVFDDRLRANERLTVLAAQLSDDRTREDTWAFVQENWGQLKETVSPYALAYMPYLLDGFCSETKAAEVEAFFAGKVAELPGAPRNLSAALETIRLCAATADAQRASVRAFLSERAEG